MPIAATGPTATVAQGHPRVAAVVLNWNGGEDTLACLRSLDASDWPALTVIVVDNASEEDIGGAVAAQHPDAVWIRNTENRGFAGGMNVGMRRGLELGADYVLLLNNDTRVDPAMVSELVGFAAEHPDAGLVCPLILAQDRPEMIVSAGLRCDLRRGHQGPPIGAGELDRGQFAVGRAVDAPAGAAMLAAAPAIREVGMLDEDLFLYGEDVEWGVRMRSRGWRVYVAGAARVWHGVSQSSGGAGSALSAYYLTRNAFAVSARYVPLRGPRAWWRTLELLGANVLHARRADAPVRNARAVLRGWRDFRHGRVGPSAPAWLIDPPGRRVRGVVISTGFDKTHMTTAAGAAWQRGDLVVALTGAYPTGSLTEWIRRAGVAEWGPMVRLVDRGERLPDAALRSLAACEAPYQVAKLLGRRPECSSAAERLAAASWCWYGRRAARELARLNSSGAIFHFRAGYGQASLEAARRAGMHVLCDHAIAHPATLEPLVASRGRVMVPQPPRSRLDRLALDDIDRSDSILVNSQFVKDTFVASGWPSEQVHVIYLGVDDQFLSCVPVGPRAPQDGPLRLMFAGRFERRKGADVLVAALRGLDALEWELTVAGPMAPDCARAHAAFLADPRVRVLGNLRRSELARALHTSGVFLFPSFAEGSARVVFEALACGCYVITTPNAGSIVENGTHGALVKSGDAEALRDAVIAAARDREAVARIGTANAQLVRERYDQRAYATALGALYATLRGPHGGTASGQTSTDHALTPGVQ
jgi:GT2 family glycosyltransferase/glycosyltransferase involved in cell wall biosynthesis